MLSTSRTLTNDEGGFRRTFGNFPDLCPAQQRAYDKVMQYLPAVDILTLAAGGKGKSLVLKHLAKALDGFLITPDAVLRAISDAKPKAQEEAILALIEKGLELHDVVLIDNFDYIKNLGGMGAIRPMYMYPQMHALVNQAMYKGKKIIQSYFYHGREDHTGGRHHCIYMERFQIEDYKFLLEHFLDRDMSDFDFQLLMNRHGHLGIREIVGIATHLKSIDRRNVNAEAMCEEIEKHWSSSNVVLKNVEHISLDSLVGIDTIAKQIERAVVLPIMRPALKRDLGIKPAKGILLHGAPGTGKTSIGRALAHALRGRFFMIDGTISPGDANFHRKIDAILDGAKKNAPSVIFVDDADVMLNDPWQSGLLRKFLGRLDGLESAGQTEVCMIMTAMNVNDLPPALLRSGRIELWIEMKLPSAPTRIDMIRMFVDRSTHQDRRFDESKVAVATADFAPADLRGLVGDAYGRIAYDRSNGKTPQSLEECLLISAELIRDRKARLKAIAQ